MAPSLEYRRRGEKIFISPGRCSRSDWFRNFRVDPGSVRVIVGFREYSPHVEIVAGVAEKEDFFKYYVTKWPWSLKTMLGLDSELDGP